MQPFSCQHREHNISKLNYELSVVEEIPISMLELHRCSLDFSFLSNVYTVFGICDWGLANSFWDHVIQISIRQINFHHIFFQQWKVKIWCGNIHSLVFSRKSYVNPIWNVMFDTHQAQISSAFCLISLLRDLSAVLSIFSPLFSSFVDQTHFVSHLDFLL